ncbi:hypothetical protein [Neolewinella maritima]|uniref:hypothetical protein n=1 Tax=Neolewinella maritima TaxID=1383882 RepID=UPI001EE84586|nr:hypothetical protein [Neolewinella maritima]
MNIFLNAVDKLISVVAVELEQLGVANSTSQLDRQHFIECKESPVDCLQSYKFPMFTPHRNLSFSETKKQFGNYVIFGSDPVYDNLYAQDLGRKNQIVVIDQQSGSVIYICARCFNSFLAAFAVLIDRDVANRTEYKVPSDMWIDQAATQAGGAEYRSFYEFVIA